MPQKDKVDRNLRGPYLIIPRKSYVYPTPANQVTFMYPEILGPINRAVIQLNLSTINKV